MKTVASEAGAPGTAFQKMLRLPKKHTEDVPSIVINCNTASLITSIEIVTTLTTTKP